MELTQQKPKADPEADSGNVILSFESYLKSSVECFKTLTAIDKEIEQTEESFIEEIKFIKHSFSIRSTEDEKTQDKKTFGIKIKEFFLKIWGFLVKVFRTIADIIVSLLKSIIIFIQKKRVQNTSLFKLVEKAGGIKAFNATTDQIIQKIFSNNPNIKSVVIKNGTCNHDLIYNMLNSSTLISFVNLPVQNGNRNSENSIEALKNRLNELITIAGDEANGRKLGILEIAVDELYRNGIFYNEVSQDSTSKDPFIQSIAVGDNKELPELISNGKVDAIGNLIVFKESQKKYDKIPLNSYFTRCFYDGNINYPLLANYFHEYYILSNKVIGKDGYIEKLEKCLKEYSKKARDDHKLISEMNKTILSEIDKYIDSDAPEARSKIALFNRFTNIVLKVKRIKSHFIRLRQTVLLNIMSLYSIENKAWMTLLKKGKALSDDADDSYISTDWNNGITNDNLLEVAIQ